jgi:hypothetical protein
MEITVLEQKAFFLPEVITSEQARERAWDKKIGVFSSGLTGIFSRPKGEDIQITYSEKRYEPFWFIACHAHYVYDRQVKFPVKTTGPEVKSVTVGSLSYPVADDKKYGAQVFLIPGTEHCQEDNQRQDFFDGISGERKDFSPTLQFTKKEISLEEFNPEAMVVAPEIRASFVVRQLFGEMIKPVQADSIFEEEVTIERLELYYRPMYAYEYHWTTKDRRAVAEFDGLSGQMRTGGKTFRQQAGTKLDWNMLFDLGADVVGLLVPGGNIAVKLSKAAIDLSKKDKRG